MDPIAALRAYYTHTKHGPIASYVPWMLSRCKRMPLHLREDFLQQLALELLEFHAHYGTIDDKRAVVRCGSRARYSTYRSTQPPRPSIVTARRVLKGERPVHQESAEALTTYWTNTDPIINAQAHSTTPDPTTPLDLKRLDRAIDQLAPHLTQVVRDRLDGTPNNHSAARAGVTNQAMSEHLTPPKWGII